MANKQNLKYVQFSKRVVVAVCIAVTVISLTGIILAFTASAIDQVTAIIRTYIEYAMVVFVAYSGNSAVEKWLVHKASIQLDHDDKVEDDDEDENG